jgi:biopolymer transport protein ExbD
MGMNLASGGSADGDILSDINTTPLIDVMLVLLVTLIISLPVMTHAVKLDMPNPNAHPPPPDQQPEVINLEIDGDGTIVWDGNPISGVVLMSHMASDEGPTLIDMASAPRSVTGSRARRDRVR